MRKTGAIGDRVGDRLGYLCTSACFDLYLLASWYITSVLNPQRNFGFSAYTPAEGGAITTPLRLFAPNWASASRIKLSACVVWDAVTGTRVECLRSTDKLWGQYKCFKSRDRFLVNSFTLSGYRAKSFACSNASNSLRFVFVEVNLRCLPQVMSGQSHSGHEADSRRSYRFFDAVGPYKSTGGFPTR